jgi:hypothetical protein
MGHRLLYSQNLNPKENLQERLKDDIIRVHTTLNITFEVIKVTDPLGNLLVTGW